MQEAMMERPKKRNHMLDNKIDVSVKVFKEFPLQRNLRLIWTVISMGLFYCWLNVTIINRDNYFKPCYVVELNAEDYLYFFSERDI